MTSAEGTSKERMQVGAVVLAAGRSSRMGFPKALASVRGRPAVETVVATCVQAGMSPRVVVLGFDADRIRERLVGRDAILVTNPDPAEGQTSSLQHGLRHVPVGHGVCLFPVDHAALRPETLRALVEAFQERPPGCEIVVPSLARRRGHPILFTPRVREEFLALAPGEPAHAVVRRDPRRLLHVETEDPAVLRDLDTREDLEWYRRQ
jgi:molybdenum cofactor cytidylyltransferase